MAMQVGLSPFHHQQSCWGKRAEPQTRCTWICILGLFAWTPQEQDGDGSSLTGNATGDFLVAVGFLSKPQGYDVPMSRVFPPPCVIASIWPILQLGGCEMNPSVLRCSQEFLFVLSSPLGLAEITVPILPAPLPADKPSLSRALPPSPRRAAEGSWRF